MLVVLTGYLFLAALVFYAIPTNESQSVSLLIENAEARSQPAQTDIGLPVSPAGRPARLTIPAINVDAAVEDVGLTPDGVMDVPSTSVDVGWYKLGQRPGEPGSAVIAGHFDSEQGESGVFNNLDTLQPGNKIYVKDEKGMTTTFVVRESRRYNPDADAAEVFGSSDGKAHLNLITCEGVWNETKNSYSHRLVVFADQEIESGH